MHSTARTSVLSPFLTFPCMCRPLLHRSMPTMRRSAIQGLPRGRHPKDALAASACQPQTLPLSPCPPVSLPVSLPTFRPSDCILFLHVIPIIHSRSLAEGFFPGPSMALTRRGRALKHEGDHPPRRPLVGCPNGFGVLSMQVARRSCTCPSLPTAKHAQSPRVAGTVARGWHPLRELVANGRFGG